MDGIVMTRAVIRVDEMEDFITMTLKITTGKGGGFFLRVSDVLRYTIQRFDLVLDLPTEHLRSADESLNTGSTPLIHGVINTSCWHSSGLVRLAKKLERYTTDQNLLIDLIKNGNRY